MKRAHLFLALVIVAAACADPVLEDQIDALGDETENVPKGEFHRVGQPCVLCHQEGGPASDSPFTVAGTVFASPTRQVGVEAAEVRMTDTDGSKHIAKTNCAGNFFVTSSDWNPKFPILVEVAKGNIRRSMRSAIGRDGSCGHCHSDQMPVGDKFGKTGHVYLFGGDEPGFPNGAEADCPVDPVRPGTQ